MRLTDETAPLFCHRSMPEVRPPATRDALVAELQRLHDESTAYWNAFSTAAFFAPLGTAWSPAETVRHLSKSVRPVARGMTLPRWALRLMFGRASRPSRGYREIVAAYQAALAAGGKAGRFAPSSRPPAADPEAERARIMAERARAATELTDVIRRWDEVALDRYRLPHPLLGKLTVREMLFFTLRHNLHHVEVTERRRAARE